MKSKIRNYVTKNGVIWLAFFIAFLPRMLLLTNVYTLSIGGDEIFSMWPAAKAVGYQWEGVMDQYRYYGYGYSILLIPLMKWIHDPIALYRSMVVLMILAQSLAAPISCHLMKLYLNVENKTILCLTGVACSYLVAVRAVYTYPEFIYTLVVWLIVWVLMKLMNSEGKKKIGFTLVVMCLLTYSLTVHLRGVALWGAFLGVFVFYLWVYRKSIVSVPVCILLGCVGYILSRKGIETVLKYLGNQQVTNMQNTSVGISAGVFEILLDPASWTAWLNIIVGQLNEALINTGGLAVAIVIVLLLILWKAVCRKNEIVETKELDYQPYIVVGGFCLLAVVITIGGQSITWLSGVTNAMHGGDPDAFRACTYFRYYGAYVGPLLMLGIGYFSKRADILEWVKGKALLAAGILQGYWVFCILPLVCYFNGCVWSYAPYSLAKGFRDDIGLRSYLPGTLMIVVILLVSYYLCGKKKQRIVLWILCAVLMYNYGYNSLFHEGDRGKMNFLYVAGGCELVENLQESGVEIEQVYVEEDYVPMSGQATTYLYQFQLLDIPVFIGEPEVEGEENIFLCFHPENYIELLESGYQIGKVSDQEYVYVSGNELQETISGYGIKLNNQIIE